MFELDSWFMTENRGTAQKEVEAIALPYKCGKIEAELIAYRFLNHEPLRSYMYVQPTPMTLL